MAFLEYRLISTLHTQGLSYEDKLYFEWMLKVSYLGSGYKKKTGKHFKYEVELTDNYVLSASKLEKAENFIRRASFRYNWAQVEVNENGIVQSINNIHEIRDRWDRIKKTLQCDYSGKSVEKYLSEVDIEMAWEKSVLKVFDRYLGYRLLFPQIPVRHPKQWEDHRKVEISEYDDIQFEEHITFDKADNGAMNYYIQGQSCSDNKGVIKLYEGNILKASDSILPVSSKLSIVYDSGRFNKSWTFELLPVEYINKTHEDN